MVMDAAKTHNSTPPPGGGWVDAEGHEGSGGGVGRRRVAAPAPAPAPEELQPPDGGWGWFIVLGNCINGAVNMSIISCFGVIYASLVSSGYTNSQVAVIPALFIGFTNLLGPVSTGFSRYYSHRRLSMLGFFIVALGVFLCSLCSNLLWLYVCFGLLAGTGSALGVPHGFILGQQYFRHKRVTANGLSMVGGSIGLMFLPPLLSYLVETYSVQGAFMLWSGILLHALVGSALYHPVEWHLRPKRAGAVDGAAATHHNGTRLINEIPGNKIMVAGKVEEQECDRVFEDESAVKRLTPDHDDTDDSDDDEEVFATHDSPLDNGDQKKDPPEPVDPGNERQWKNPLTDVLQTNEYLERPRTVSIERSMEILPQIPEEEESEDDDCFETYDPESGNERVEFLNRENEMRNRPVSYITTKSVDSIAKIPSCESIFDSHDVVDQFGSALSFKVEKLKDSVHAENTDSSRKSGKSNSLGKQQMKPYILCGLKIPRLQYIINFSIMRHPMFLIIACSSIANRIVYACFWTFLPSFWLEVGVGRQGPYLVSITAGCEILAKVVMSIIIDQSWMQRRYFCMMAACSSSVAIFTITLAWDFATLGVCCGLYGISVGTIMSIGPVMLVEYLGLKLLPHSFGLMLFMNGVSGLSILPLTGWLNDVVGDYKSAFYVLGSLTLIPCLLWSLTPLFSKGGGEDSKTRTDNV